MDGSWALWSSWSPCSVTVTCVIGLRDRTRACNDPQTAHRGQPCSGPGQETATCAGGICPGTTRFIVLFHILPHPICNENFWSWRYLPNQSNLFLSVDGAWSLWSTWACPVTCGPGAISRTRSCNNPMPQNGGADCADNPTESNGDCGLAACPGMTMC